MSQASPVRVVVVLFLLLVGSAVRGAAPPVTEQEAVRRAVQRALPLLLKGAQGHIAKRTCFACHNQTHPLLTLATARERGFAVREQDLKEQLDFIADFLQRNRSKLLKGQGLGGEADTVGYALYTLDIGGWKPDETTTAAVEYLLVRNKDVDHWRTSGRRPPSEASTFTPNALALAALRKYGTGEQKERIEARVEAVRSWLRKSPARDTEDRVFRLWGLKAAGADDKEVQAAVQDLVKTQRPDGGWGQLEGMASDAYAIGSALVALHVAGGMSTEDRVYRRGLAFLLATQKEDGSWLVRSRSKPFQTYYESGFPHGKDQFISSAASGWAATALALACPVREK